jgi:hypothetical protein
MHPMSGLSVENMEGDAFRGRGGGVKRDRANYVADPYNAFPVCAWSHGQPVLKAA